MLQTVTRRFGRLSPPDWIFMPLYALGVAGLIYLALSWRPAGAEAVVTETSYTLAGRALAQMVPGAGTTLQLLTSSEDDIVVRLSAEASFEVGRQNSPGIVAVLPAEFERRAIGQRVRVEFDVRRAPDNGSEEARISYFTVGHGASGWQPADIGEDWSTIGLCYQLRDTAVANDNELVGIWPDLRGGGRSLLLREVRVVIEPEGTGQGECQARIGAG